MLDGTLGEVFSTAVCATFDPTALTLQYATAGHPPPLLVRATGETEFLDQCGSAPLTTGAVKPLSATVQLSTGDSVFFFTDGLVERRNRTLDDGFSELTRACTPQATKRTLEEIVATLTSTSATEDDVCLVRLTVDATKSPSSRTSSRTTQPPEAITFMRPHILSL